MISNVLNGSNSELTSIVCDARLAVPACGRLSATEVARLKRHDPVSQRIPGEPEDSP